MLMTAMKLLVSMERREDPPLEARGQDDRTTGRQEDRAAATLRLPEKPRKAGQQIGRWRVCLSLCIHVSPASARPDD